MDQINEWTDKQKMIISEKKTKAMLFNFTDKYQFSTRLQLKGQNVQIVDQMKFLGTVVNSDLTWTDNCMLIIKKVNNRMQLIRNIFSFGATREEMVHLWIVFCRSVLEQSCVVWHSSLTQDNREDIERTQKTFCKLILQENYGNYENALMKLNLLTLEKRREILCLKFAKSGIKYEKLNDLFPKKSKEHNMKTRNTDEFNTNFANTQRLKKGSIITMQNYLNEDANQNKKRRIG